MTFAKPDQQRDQPSAPSPANARRGELAFHRSKDRSMKKPKPKERKVAIRVRVKPSVKAMADRLAQKDARSLADWLERLIARERARRLHSS
jgi:predicted HicB family RNase H-like nuclease